MVNRAVSNCIDLNITTFVRPLALGRAFRSKISLFEIVVRYSNVRRKGRFDQRTAMRKMIFIYIGSEHKKRNDVLTVTRAFKSTSGKALLLRKNSKTWCDRMIDLKSSFQQPSASFASDTRWANNST